MLKIHETTTASGGLSSVFLRLEDGVLAIVSDEGTFALVEGALDAVMARFGAPLEPAERVAEIERIELGDGRALRHVRHLARGDVIARDYVVYEVFGQEPRCALATTVAAALAHLGRAAAAVDP